MTDKNRKVLKLCPMLEIIRQMIDCRKCPEYEKCWERLVKGAMKKKDAKP
jgi:hypothetical protein